MDPRKVQAMQKQMMKKGEDESEEEVKEKTSKYIG